RPGAQGRETLTDHAERLQRVLDAFDDLGIAGLDLEPMLDERADLVREHDGPRRGDRLQARPDVGGETIDVVLVEVDVHQAVMDSHADFNGGTDTRFAWPELVNRAHQGEAFTH